MWSSTSSASVWICRRLAPVMRMKKSKIGVMPRRSKMTMSLALLSSPMRAHSIARSRLLVVGLVMVAVASFKGPPLGCLVRLIEADSPARVGNENPIIGHKIESEVHEFCEIREIGSMLFLLYSNVSAIEKMRGKLADS